MIWVLIAMGCMGVWFGVWLFIGWDQAYEIIKRKTYRRFKLRQ